MKILVIAYKGQLGKELCALIKRGESELRSYSREELDITNYEKVKRVVGEYSPDVIINTAAHHATIEGENNPSRLFAVNAFALKNLAIVSRKNNSKLVTFSSDYVFDGQLGRSYKEDDVPHPIQYFGLSKYIGELIAKNYHNNSFIIRTSGVYGGVEGSQSKRNFVLNLLNESKSKEVIDVSSEQIVSPTFAHDLAKATLALINNISALPGIYHLTNTGQCSWAEFSEEIIKIKKLRTHINPVDRKGESGGIRRPIYSALANVKGKALGIDLPSWQDGLKRYITYLSSSV